MEEKKTINPEPLTIEVMDLGGKNHTLKARTITRKMVPEMSKILFEDSTRQPLEDQVAFQLAYMYETDINFWDNFDLRVMRRAVKVFLADLQSPLM